MTIQRAVLALAIAACAAAGCGERGASDGPTSVMGGSDGRPRADAQPGITDARGREIPLPRMPANVAPRVVSAGMENALALWIQDGVPVAAMYAPPSGWSAAQPLEELHGDASDAQLVANTTGSGMAIWRHTVGSIQSLRFSRFEPATGWSVPDVMPGALPRPPGEAPPPQAQMDDAGNVTARWPSGFDAHQTQASRYTPGQGWSQAISESVASGPSASPALPSPSSVR